MLYADVAALGWVCLLAELALSANDPETVLVSLPRPRVLDCQPHSAHDAAELVAKDVSLLHLHCGTVEQQRYNGWLNL